MRLLARVFWYILARRCEARAKRAVSRGKASVAEVQGIYAQADSYFRRAGYPG